MSRSLIAALLGVLTMPPVAAQTPPPSRRDDLLAADRAVTRLSDALAEDVLFLHPRSPLLRGRTAARPFADSLHHTPVFAAVSADGRFGYTWGWTERESQPGKYLACWRRARGGSPWRITAFAHNPSPASPPSETPGQRPPPPPRVRRDTMGSTDLGPAARREIFAADSAFARRSMDSGPPAAFVAFAAPDAISLPGGAHIVFGREAIRAEFADWPAGATLDWAPIAGEAADAGELGCTVGLASFTGHGENGAVRHSFSKYLTVWRRQPDGAWKFVADAGNSRPEPTR
jgi:ketosteroid isomerase-like protein